MKAKKIQKTYLNLKNERIKTMLIKIIIMLLTIIASALMALSLRKDKEKYLYIGTALFTLIFIASPFI